MQQHMYMYFVTEDMIINLSPVFKLLEEKQHTEMFLVANFVWYWNGLS